MRLEEDLSRWRCVVDHPRSLIAALFGLGPTSGLLAPPQAISDDAGSTSPVGAGNGNRTHVTSFATIGICLASAEDAAGGAVGQQQNPAWERLAACQLELGRVVEVAEEAFARTQDNRIDH